MSDEEIASLITELSRLNEVLKSDFEARNLNGMRSHVADLRNINEEIHRLLSGPTSSHDDMPSPMWLIGTTANHLSEAVAAPAPDWDRISAILSFLESGIDQLIHALG